MEVNKDITYIKSLDLLRGLAAISVTLFHFVIIGRLSHPSLFRDVFSIGHLGVQVFFVISGFVIPFSMYKGNYSLKKIVTFFKKRIVRLEPPYLASILLIFLINWIFFISPYWHEELLDVSFKQVVFHLGYLNSFFNEGWLNQVYWSLGIEFQYYFFIAFFYIIISGSLLKWGVSYILLISLSFLFPFDSFLFQHLPFFVIGILVFRFLTEKDSIKIFIVFLIVTLVVICFKYNSSFEYLMASILPLFFFFLIKNVGKIGEFLGKISYSIYLIHVPIGQHLIKIGIGFTQNVLEETLLIILTFLITLFFSYIFYKLIEKPSQAFTKRFRY